jgi:hypothetical protein
LIFQPAFPFGIDPGACFRLARNFLLSPLLFPGMTAGDRLKEGFEHGVFDSFRPRFVSGGGAGRVRMG